jgi:hypothetical protein
MSVNVDSGATLAAVPQDANDLRGFHMRRLMAKPVTWIAGGISVLAVGIGLAVGVGPLIGLIGAVVVALIVLVIVFAIADNRAEDDFFRAYASARGLQWSDSRGSLPPVTALLRKGDNRYTELTLTGQLPAGPNGLLAYYTYEEESTDSDGNRQTSYYHFTVAFCELPEVSMICQELALQRRSGFRFLDSTEDKFRKRQRVEVESEEFDKRYETFIGEHDDMNTARQIFEPSFIVWLSENAPKNFSFELVAGALCLAVKGQLDNAKDLDALCAGAGIVAKRLAGEAAEEPVSVPSGAPQQSA